MGPMTVEGYTPITMFGTDMKSGMASCNRCGAVVVEDFEVDGVSTVNLHENFHRTVYDLVARTSTPPDESHSMAELLSSHTRQVLGL
jgi:hypothetical protein